MGLLKSEYNWIGYEINGVLLGYPNVLENGLYQWEGDIPNGVILADGTIDLSSESLGDFIGIGEEVTEPEQNKEA